MKGPLVNMNCNIDRCRKLDGMQIFCQQQISWANMLKCSSECKLRSGYHDPLSVHLCFPPGNFRSRWSCNQLCVFFIINYRCGPPLVNHLSDISKGFSLHSRINIGNLGFRVRLVTSIALEFHPTFSLLDGFHCSRIKGRK